MSEWDKIRTDAEVMFSRHYQRCVDLVPEIAFDSQNRHQLVALCLYSSVIELAESVCLLVSRNQFTGIPALIRSMYEADIDLINCLNDEEYIDSLHATYIARLVNIMQSAHDTSEPGYVAIAGGIAGIRSTLRQLRRQLKTLRQGGHEPIQVAERFKRAQRGREYISAYAHLCSHSHNNIGALEERHLRISEGGDVRLMLFDGLGIRNEVHLIDLANTVVIGASGRTHDFFSSGKVEEIESMLSKLRASHKYWPENGHA